MNPDLERLIALQQLDSAAHDATRRLADQSEREKVFAARLQAAGDQLAAARAQLTENQNARRVVEKEVAVQQGRLSKFRDQLMEVKTNREFQAIQHEIETAQNEVKSLEEKVLEHMIAADDLTSVVKRGEAGLASEQKAVDADRDKMLAENGELKTAAARMAAERTALVAAIDQRLLAIYDGVAKKRNGIAVAEARDGICGICHVRLRPQVFNTVLKNEQILQCDYCNRILYHTPKTAAPDPLRQPAP
ncbi:MAG: C4-type zinc ribbon domain-containing protein [Acidobacteriota bacterium]